MTLFSNASKIVAGFYQIDVVVNQRKQSSIQDNRVRSDVAKAMECIKVALELVEGSLLPHLTEAASELLKHSVFAGFRIWFGFARDACSKAAGDVYKNVMSHSKKLATEVAGNTPHYAHLFQKTPNPLAKKVLLKAPSRDSLMKQTLLLHGCVVVAVEWRTRWLVSCDAEDVDMAELQNTFKAAKAACSVVAACSVLWEQSGAQQKSQRDKLLSRSRPEFPPCLLHALQAL